MASRKLRIVLDTTGAEAFIDRLRREEEKMSQEAAPAVVRRTFTPDVTKLNTETREVTHKISDHSLDRTHDVMETSGWELDDYRKNPVVLADHSYSVANIIGRSTGQVIKKNGLFATTQFDDEGLGAVAFRLVEKDLAKAWSVGFRALDSHSVNEGVRSKCTRCKQTRKLIIGEKDPDEVSYIYGRHFLKQALLEYSLVAIPANPNAVMSLLAEGVKDGSVPQVDIDTLGALLRPEEDDDIERIIRAVAKEFVGTSMTTHLASVVTGLEQSLAGHFESLVPVVQDAVKTSVAKHFDVKPKESDTEQIYDELITGKNGEEDTDDDPHASKSTDADDSNVPVAPKPTASRVEAALTLSSALAKRSRNLTLRGVTRRIGKD